MKNDEILHVLEHIDADLIQAADALPKKKPTRPYWYAAVAAVLALAIALPMVLNGHRKPADLPHIESKPTAPPTAPPDWIDETVPIGGPTLVPLSMVEPVYPTMVPCPNYADYTDREQYQLDYDAWQGGQKRQYNQPKGYADSLTNFFQASIEQFLQGEGNSTYSPVNVYLAMAMLAETAHGNSRWQILNLFGLDNIDQLRKQASYVWNAHYSDDQKTTLKIANSLWLDDAYAFKQATADRLAETYYASSFSGDLGTDEANQKLQAWLNQNTAGLLQEQAKKVELDPESVFALASTIYFSASWEDEFDENDTTDGIFHSTNGDKRVPFMYKALSQYTCYRGENFSAVSLRLSGKNSMWFILPDEGHTVEEILKSDDYLQMTMDPNKWENKKNYYRIYLNLPKFDVTDQKDLIAGMKAMGITDVFDSGVSDFTSITDTTDLYVGKIDHAARVSIDETGCFGAAFTVIDVPRGSAPGNFEEMNFVLDRPFLFVVSSQDNLPLFAGIVNEP